jgi:hypothetical protein
MQRPKGYQFQSSPEAAGPGGKIEEVSREVIDYDSLTVDTFCLELSSFGKVLNAKLINWPPSTEVCGRNIDRR